MRQEKREEGRRAHGQGVALRDLVHVHDLLNRHGTVRHGSTEENLRIFKMKRSLREEGRFRGRGRGGGGEEVGAPLPNDDSGSKR